MPNWYITMPSRPIKETIREENRPICCNSCEFYVEIDSELKHTVCDIMVHLGLFQAFKHMLHRSISLVNIPEYIVARQTIRKAIRRTVCLQVYSWKWMINRRNSVWHCDILNLPAFSVTYRHIYFIILLLDGLKSNVTDRTQSGHVKSSSESTRFTRGFRWHFLD